MLLPGVRVSLRMSRSVLWKKRCLVSPKQVVPSPAPLYTISRQNSDVRHFSESPMQNTTAQQGVPNFKIGLSKRIDRHFQKYGNDKVVMRKKFNVRSGMSTFRIDVYGSTVADIVNYINNLSETINDASSVLRALEAARDDLLRHNSSVRYVSYDGERKADFVNLYLSPFRASPNTDLSDVRSVSLPRRVTLRVKSEANLEEEIEKSQVYGLETESRDSPFYVISGNVVAMSKLANWLYFRSILTVVVRNGIFINLPESKLIRGRERLNTSKLTLPFSSEFQKNFIKSCHYALKPWKMDKSVVYTEFENTMELKGNPVLLESIESKVKEAYEGWAEVPIKCEGDIDVLLTKEASLYLNHLFPGAKFWVDRETQEGICYGYPKENVEKLAEHIMNKGAWENQGTITSKDEEKLEYVRYHYLQQRKRYNYDVVWCKGIMHDEEKNTYSIMFMGDAGKVKEYRDKYQNILERTVSRVLPIPGEFLQIPIIRPLLTFYFQSLYDDLHDIMLDIRGSNIAIISYNEDAIEKAKDVIINDVFTDKKAQFLSINTFPDIRLSSNFKEKIDELLLDKLEANPDIKVKVWRNYGIGIVGESSQNVTKFKMSLYPAGKRDEML